MEWLLTLTRLWGFAVAVLVVAWAFTFKSSFLTQSGAAVKGDDEAIFRLDHIYSALHPLLMVIGFILLSGEAILAHRRLVGWSRATRMFVHLSIHAVALNFGLFGIWTKFKGKAGIASNFYSLHSWIGVASVALFASQWVIGFISMWHKTQGRRTRSAVLPWHVFVGLYAFGLAVMAAETGLQEKLVFLQGRRGLAPWTKEAALVNTIGISLAVLAAAVILAAISPRNCESQVKTFVKHEGAINGKSHV